MSFGSSTMSKKFSAHNAEFFVEQPVFVSIETIQNTLDSVLDSIIDSIISRRLNLGMLNSFL